MNLMNEITIIVLEKYIFYFVYDFSNETLNP